MCTISRLSFFDSQRITPPKVYIPFSIYSFLFFRTLHKHALTQLGDVTLPGKAGEFLGNAILLEAEFFI